MKTDLISTGELTSQLTIVLEKDDYVAKYDQELKKLKNKAHLKGFRKGMIPMTALKKMYGKGVLIDVINEELQNKLSSYLTDNGIDVLGNPLPSESQKAIDFDLKELGEFEFIFDLGMAPKFAINGIDSNDAYDNYKVVVTEDMLDDELNSLRKRMGKQEDVDEAIEMTDIVSLEIIEKSENKEREAYQNSISLLPERLTEEMQSVILGKRLGEEFDLDIFKLEKDSTEDYTRKYFLKDSPDDVSTLFKGTIARIRRLLIADLDQVLFDKAFGEGSVSNEGEARDFLKNELEQFYDDQGRAITKRYILEALIDKNDIILPEEFLKRWLVSTNEKVTPEEVDKDFDGFAKNLKWTLIKQNVSKRYDIRIEPDDLRNSIKAKIIQQFGSYGTYPGINFDDMTNRIMQNQETVEKEYEELLAEKVLDKLCDVVTLSEKKLSLNEYKEIVKSLQENNAQ